MPTEDSPMIDEDIEIRYDLAIRYKNSDTQEWQHMFEIGKGTLETQNVHCNEGKVCATFNVAFIPTLTHDMYDIYIHVRENKYIKHPDSEIHFRYSYVDPAYSYFFMLLRYVFVGISTLFFLIFLYLVTCRSQFNVCKQFRRLRSPQMFFIFLGLGLIAFNNPYHFLVLLTPTYTGQVLEMM